MFQYSEEFSKGSIEFAGHVKFSYEPKEENYSLCLYKKFKTLTELCELLKPETLLQIVMEKNATKVKRENVFFSAGNDNTSNQICLYEDGESSASLCIEKN